jgi:Glycosyl hydrolase family 79 C-terminal beta domain
MPWTALRIDEIERAAGEASAARRAAATPPPVTGTPRGGPTGRRGPLFSARATVGIVTALAFFGATAARGRSGVRASHPSIRITLRHGGAVAISPGFLGLSLEYTAIERYAGEDPHSINPVFLQLIRNLTAGQEPVLRIGGDSTDWTWWPVRHVAQPPGVTITLTDQWLAVMHALASTLHARLMLGVNLEANSARLAAAEARALVGGVGRRFVIALELGNEPELYPSFAWYHTRDGKGVPGRPAGYGFAAFAREFAHMGRVVRPEPLAGPTNTASTWLSHWDAFVRNEPNLRVATLHRYGLHACTSRPTAPGYPTPRHLLSLAASALPANRARPFVAIAHAHRIPLRIDEMNSTPCNNVPPIAGESFASALWALDALFEMANARVDGVNIHTYPSASYNLFTFTNMDHRWSAVVNPEYYGLLMFAQAAPKGSRLLRISRSPHSAIRAWATEGADHKVRIVLINDGDVRRSVTVAGFAPRDPVTGEALRAPSITSRSGVSLGGQSFAPATTTGLLAGRRSATAVRVTNGTLSVNVPATSALLITVAAR